MYYTGFITIGDIISASLYISMIFLPITSIGWFMNNISRAEVAKIRIAKLKINDEYINVNGRGSISLDENFDLEISNLHVKITDNKILENISFKSEVYNEKIGIVGKSGSGKSVLVETILGFNKYIGNIRISGHEITELTNEELNYYFSYAPSNPILFEGTITDNIVLFNHNIDYEKVDTLVRLCYLDRAFDKEVSVQNKKKKIRG